MLKRNPWLAEEGSETILRVEGILIKIIANLTKLACCCIYRSGAIIAWHLNFCKAGSFLQREIQERDDNTSTRGGRICVFSLEKYFLGESCAMMYVCV